MNTSIDNWTKWHLEKSEDVIGDLFTDSGLQSLTLSFRYRGGLEENAACLMKYLRVVSEYESTLERAMVVDRSGELLFDVVGSTGQGNMDKDRLLGWLQYMVSTGHEFGCWLQSWEVVGEPAA